MQTAGRTPVGDKPHFRITSLTYFWAQHTILCALCKCLSGTSVDAKNSAEAKSTVGQFDLSRARSEGATCIILWYHIWKSNIGEQQVYDGIMEQNRGENSPGRLQEKKCQVWCSHLQVVAWLLWAGRAALFPLLGDSGLCLGQRGPVDNERGGARRARDSWAMGA